MTDDDTDRIAAAVAARLRDDDWHRWYGRPGDAALPPAEAFLDSSQPQWDHRPRTPRADRRHRIRDLIRRIKR